MAFDSIVLSGGGIKGIGQLGVLHYYYENGLLDFDLVKQFAGTSAGAAICLLLVCGYLPMEIFQKMYETSNFFAGAGPKAKLDFANIFSIFKDFGLISIQPFIDIIGEMVVAKLGKSPTLSELQTLTGKTLTVTCVNVHKMSLDYFTPVTKPRLKAIDAVKMSCNLPIIFQRLLYNNDYRVDGGLGDNFPYEAIEGKCSKTLGIIVTGIDSSDSDSGAELGFPSYLYRIVALPINIMTRLRCKNLGDSVTLIKLNYDNISLLEFSMDRAKKLDMFMKGYSEAEREAQKTSLRVEGWLWDAPAALSPPSTMVEVAEGWETFDGPDT